MAIRNACGELRPYQPGHAHNFVMSKFTRAIQRKLYDQTGDVPGWVLVTLMTAALVVALWFLAWPAFEGLFNDSIENMTNVG